MEVDYKRILKYLRLVSLIFVIFFMYLTFLDPLINNKNEGQVLVDPVVVDRNLLDAVIELEDNSVDIGGEKKSQEEEITIPEIQIDDTEINLEE